jgi:dihydropteroate synthase
MVLRCRNFDVSLESVAVMGVLNVTPDSFSDGGLWLDPDAAVGHGVAMVAEGAAIIDVGGESTRPGAAPVTESEELRRVLPVVEALSETVSVPISVDTRRPRVASSALEAGAAMINDTSGEAADPDMAAVVASTGAGIVVMHSRGTPETMLNLTTYSDVVQEVASFLVQRAGDLENQGVAHGSIAVDPGFGFAKTAEQNLELLARLDELMGLGYPLVAGTSRKSFIGRVLRAVTSDRVEGTIATVVWAVEKGARIVRVHDVRPVLRAVRMIEAIQGAIRHGEQL